MNKKGALFVCFPGSINSILNLYKAFDFMLRGPMVKYTLQSFHPQWFDSGTGPDVDTCIYSWLMKGALKVFIVFELVLPT